VNNIKNLIIDGTNLEFRIFYVSKSLQMFTEEGEQTSCIFKFLQTFKRLVNQFNPDNIYCAWDRKIDRETKNFRKILMKGQYKVGRPKPPDIEEMFKQEVKLIEALEYLGCKHMFPNTLEADDVVGYLARKLEGPNIVVSVDRDLYQLVDDKNSVYNLKEIITATNFKDIVGVHQSNFKLYKAILGDPADTIPGLPGYGPVRSKRLAEEWKESNISEDYKEIVKKNMKLIDLDLGYLMQLGEKQSYDDQFKSMKVDNKESLDNFKKFCEKYNFEEYLNNFNDWRHVFSRNNLIKTIESLSENTK